MNPDVLRAIPELEGRGVLTSAKARELERIARGDRISIYYELRFLLYVGILLIVGGAGVLVKDHLQNIGPLTIALGIGLASVACLAWAARVSARFSWGEVPSPNLAFDYILLLGVLLLSSDLAYIETQFTPLGANWPWHLLMMSAVMLALSVRYDSRVLFSLALTTFASWRGISVTILEGAMYSRAENLLRANMSLCGIFFLALGIFLDRSGRKAHFEPTAAHIGWFLILSALASGTMGGRHVPLVPYAAGMMAVGAGLAVWSFVRRRFSLFAMGVLGGYWGLSALAVEFINKKSAELLLLWFVVSAGGVIAVLIAANSRMDRRS